MITLNEKQFHTQFKKIAIKYKMQGAKFGYYENKKLGINTEIIDIDMISNGMQFISLYQKEQF